MEWKLTPQPDFAEVSRLEKALGTKGGSFPRALATILHQRGITSVEEAKQFLVPSPSQMHDPFLMKGMDLACNRILSALQKRERILIYGDYDVDGTTSVSLLKLFFHDLGLDFETYIPNRFTEGYGISFEGVQHAFHEGCKLLIALDCGMKAVDKVRFANEKGIDVIVVDHHKAGDELPAAVALLNPLQPGCGYPDKNLSACALTMKLCQGILQKIRSQPETFGLDEAYDPFLRYCDLVAISIACDIVPLSGENRTMLHFGLEKIRKNPSAGIEALKGLHEDDKEWSVSDLVFYMGPRVNSAGRLKNATEAVELLTGRSENLVLSAQKLDAFNQERKSVEKEIHLQALEMIDAEEAVGARSSTVLFGEKWNKGVIGIVASRLIERYHRPTILLTRSGDYLVGSGRSVPGFDLYETIDACSDCLIQYGGHKYAAGITLREVDYPRFREKFEHYVSTNILDSSKQPELRIDTGLDFPELDPRFMRLLKRIAPFGPSNPEPNFLARGVKVKEASHLKQEHVRFQFEQNGIYMEGIGFYMASRWEKVNQLLVDLVFQPDIKSWKGRTYIQLKVKDLKPCR
jgi:single-stranded-DNA-specific exonuclease